MAANQVLHMPELLEMILEDLPFKEVLRITRINKAVRDIVQASPKLQRKLFFLQESNTTTRSASEIDDISEVEYSDSILTKTEMTDGIVAALAALVAVWKATPKLLINPILQVIFNSFSEDTRVSIIRMMNPQSSHGSYWANNPTWITTHQIYYYKKDEKFFVRLHIRGKCQYEKMEALLKEKADWQEMYVTNRPCAITFKFGGWQGEYRLPAGVKMGVLVKHVVKRH